MDYPSIRNLKHLTTKEKWREIIFEADTAEGRRFDIWLLVAILISVIAVMGESVNELSHRYGTFFKVLEYFFTVIFSIEYITRIIVAKNKKKYIFSFWGIVDLLSTIPSYLALFIHGPQYLLMIRSLRLLRVFRVLRLTSFNQEAKQLGLAIKQSGAKIIVFFGVVLTSVIIMGTLMFVIESPEAGFTSIPRSIYWAIVTLTTVGYGDIAPVTSLGQFLSAVLMILGYAVIAVPTGIVSVEMHQLAEDKRVCSGCAKQDHDKNAIYCKHCGTELS